jgi:hypothetical protein
MFLRCGPLLGAALLFVSGLAGAQTLTAPTNIRRHENQIGMSPNWINRADCEAGEVINFAIGVSGSGNTSYGLRAFVGTNCENAEARDGIDATCFAVAGPFTLSQPSTTVPIAVRDIIRAVRDREVATVDGGTDAGTGAGGAGSEDDGECGGLEHPTDFKISFLLLNNNMEPEGYMPTSWSGAVDLTGPAAPSGVKAGTGENTLVISWTANSSTPVGEMRGFNLYCDPPAGAGADSDAGIACPNTTLVPGQTAPSANLCGSAPGNASSRETSPLTNGVSYTVAVAAEDSFYNAGPLSSTVCSRPEPVTGFFEAYRAAGGQAGGGFCSVHAGRSQAGAGVVLLSLLAFAIRRRSRQNRGAPS